MSRAGGRGLEVLARILAYAVFSDSAAPFRASLATGALRGFELRALRVFHPARIEPEPMLGHRLPDALAPFWSPGSRAEAAVGCEQELVVQFFVGLAWGRLTISNHARHPMNMRMIPGKAATVLGP
jgi:hypothetical protein